MILQLLVPPQWTTSLSLPPSPLELLLSTTSIEGQCECRYTAISSQLQYTNSSQLFLASKSRAQHLFAQPKYSLFFPFGTLGFPYPELLKCCSIIQYCQVELQQDTTLHHLLLRPENFAVQVETKTGLQIVGHMQNNLAFVCARLTVCWAPPFFSSHLFSSLQLMKAAFSMVTTTAESLERLAQFGGLQSPMCVVSVVVEQQSKTAFEYCCSRSVCFCIVFLLKLLCQLPYSSS